MPLARHQPRPRASANQLEHPAFDTPGCQHRIGLDGASGGVAKAVRSGFYLGGNYRDIWGLFADDDGGNPSWDFLATLPDPNDQVTAIGSRDGSTVLVGTQAGNIFSADPRSGTVRKLPFASNTPLFTGQVFQFAFGNTWSVARYQNALARLDIDGGAWSILTINGLPFNEGFLYFMATRHGQNAECSLRRDGLWRSHELGRRSELAACFTRSTRPGPSLYPPVHTRAERRAKAVSLHLRLVPHSARTWCNTSPDLGPTDSHALTCAGRHATQPHGIQEARPSRQSLQLPDTKFGSASVTSGVIPSWARRATGSPNPAG